MNNNNQYNDIKGLIEKDKLNEAFEKLKAIIKDKDMLTDLIMQSAKYNELQQLIRNDAINFEQVNISKSKIRHSLLQLINDIEKDNASTVAPFKSKKLIVAISISLIAILILFFSGIFQKKSTGVVSKSFSDLENLTIQFNQSFDFISPKDNNYLWHPFSDANGWNGSLKNGYYILENATSSMAVKYFYIQLGQEENIVSIDVKLESPKKDNPFASNGLLLDFDSISKNYYAFTITPQGEYNLIRKNGQKIDLLFSEKIKTASAGAFVKLAACVKKEEMYLYIADELVKKLKIEKTDKSDVGIIALGKGKFYFDNLLIYKQSE